MNTLRIGSRGPQTELLQAALSRAGFDAGAIDGVFGPATFAAAARFQQSRGLTPDGIVGPLTWAALRPYITGYLVHTVRPGDTLYLLSRRYGTSLSAIQTANPTANPLNLRVGASLVIPLPFPVVFTNISFTYPLLQLTVEGLRARYPFLQSGSIGRSLYGRELVVLSIGEGPSEVFYNASHHANEWITTPVLMHFIEQYASAFASGNTIYGVPANELYYATTLYAVPMVNPDGVDLVTGEAAPGSAEYQAALGLNPPGFPFPEGWKANLAGVDLNLNYPARWELAREIKFAQGFTQPGPRDFVGPAPLSEPESRAVAEFTQNRDFQLTLSYHSQGEVIYWRFADFLPPGSLEIGQRMSAASGYPLETTPYDAANAGYKDWFIQTYNRPGYTIEVGRGINPLPIAQFPQIYSDNLGILVIGMQPL